jgi:hypothetical protein
MNIFIQDSSSTPIPLTNIHPYESIHSILHKIYPDSNYDHIYLSYQNKIIDNLDLSLDYYHIQNNSTLQLHHRVSGGGFGDFISFSKKHFWIVLFGIILSLLPLIMLPTGMISFTATLLKVVFQQSFERIGLFLATTLGKYSLYKRLQFIISIFQYITFILITYVSLTFPILVLCLTLKGKSIFSNPKNMCSPMNAAFITGIVLTTLYMLIYTSFRGFGNILEWIKSFFTKNQYTQATLAPATEGLKDTYNQAKYLAISRNPVIGNYYVFLDKTADFVTLFINTMLDIGCKQKLSPSRFMSKFTKQEDKLEYNKSTGQTKIEIQQPKSNEEFDCCTPDNYINTANLLYDILNKNESIQMLKSKDFYSSCILIAITFFEKAYSSDKNISESDKVHIENKLNDLELKLKNFSESNHQTYVPSNYGFVNSFLKAFFFYSICNVFTLAKNSNVLIQEVGSIYEVTDILKSGSATGTYMVSIYVICYIALLICGLFDIY